MSKVSETDVRAEVRAWLAANWDPEMSLVAWRNKLVDSGWGMPHWPEAWYGRGLPLGLVRAVEEEFARIGAVGVAKSGVRLLAAATLLEHGTDRQKERFLRRILTGEDTWCQLFSEPGSGSDLAGATTRADLHGDYWLINGQKVWTTSAHHADHGLLLARTDWDAPKHEGLSYFVIDIKQPGVDVQPLKQMNGHASFNQVFFTDAHVPAENLVGRIGEGWKVAMTTLAHERRGADGLSAPAKRGARTGRIYVEERSGRAAHRTREPARRDHRGDFGVGARYFHCRRHGRDSTQHHRRARARPPERATVRYRSVPAGAQELAKVAVAAARTSVRPCASQLSARHGHALCARWQTASSSRGSAPSSIPGERARTRASANIKEFIMLEHR